MLKNVIMNIVEFIKYSVKSCIQHFRIEQRLRWRCYTASLTCLETPNKLPHVLFPHIEWESHDTCGCWWLGGGGSDRHLVCCAESTWESWAAMLMGGGARSWGRKQYYLCTVVLSRVTARRLKVALHNRPPNPLDF